MVIDDERSILTTNKLIHLKVSEVLTLYIANVCIVTIYAWRLMLCAIIDALQGQISEPPQAFLVIKRNTDGKLGAD